MKKYYDILIDGPKSGNALFTVFPYKKNGGWYMDDESKGIILEPFVGGADTLLDVVANGKHELTAVFSNQPFKGYDFVAEKRGGDEFGTDYYSEKHNHEFWLCAVLFQYINPSPEKLYIQIK